MFATWGALTGLAVAIVLIVRKATPAYALVLGALVGGLLGGGSLADTVAAMVSGAQAMMPSVLRILTSGILAGALVKTGSAEKIADAIVRALPHKLDTVLTESVRNFSAGERLRFALAREILRDTRILLVDEATAHLDSDNETRFLETVLHVFRSRTVLMIRHTPHPLTDGFPVLRITPARS